MNDPATTAFRLGDIRGIYPDEIDEAFAARFAEAFVKHFNITGRIATGRDVRDSSASLQDALNNGFIHSGIDVVDLGLCATELGYFASTRPEFEAAVIVTASHNAACYNGFKCVLRNGEAVAFDSGLEAIMQLMRSPRTWPAHQRGTLKHIDLQPDYLAFLEHRFSFARYTGGKIALNGLNGTAATLAASIAEQQSLPVGWFRREPGPIPDDGADPTNPRLAAQMKQFMTQDDFALGIAWDGDCDRCVFFDRHGDILPTYYMVGLLAGHFLSRRSGAAIVFDTKLCWNTLRVIEQYGGKPVPSRTGHAFMKRNMQAHGAAYGGESSSHHFFGDFFHCDSGMLAWLTVLELTSRLEQNIDELIAERRATICCTREINLKLADADRVFTRINTQFAARATDVGHLDGLSMSMRNGWRFSLTRSKTEPLIRLNMESRAGTECLLTEGAALLHLLQPFDEAGDDLSTRLVIQ